MIFVLKPVQALRVSLLLLPNGYVTLNNSFKCFLDEKEIILGYDLICSYSYQWNSNVSTIFLGIEYLYDE